MVSSPFEGLDVPVERIRDLVRQLEGRRRSGFPTFDLTQGNPIGPVAKDYAEAIRDFVAQEESGNSRTNAYTSSIGFPPFLNAVVELEERVNQWNIPVEHVMAVPGAAEGITLLLWGLKKSRKGPDGEVVILSPYFPPYLGFVRNLGFTPRVIPFGSDEEVLSGLESAVGETTRAVIVNSPNNPCGKIYDPGFLWDMGEIIDRDLGILVISDEPYRQLLLPGQPWVSVVRGLNYPNTAVVYSFSKEGRLAGCRIGYLALHPDFPEGRKVIPHLASLLISTGPVQASTREQAALAKCSLPLNLDWSGVMDNIRFYAKELPKRGFEVIQSQGGLYLCVRHPSNSGDTLAARLLEEGVGVVPGGAFGIPDYVRMALCGPDADKKEEILAGFSVVNTRLSER